MTVAVCDYNIITILLQTTNGFEVSDIQVVNLNSVQ